MYHSTVSPSQDDEHRSRPIPRDSNHQPTQPAPPAQSHHHHQSQSSPTQQSFNPPPPTLQPSFNPSIPSANPPPQPLPSISASLFQRDPPVSKYYDPTLDTSEPSVIRRPRFEPYTSEVNRHQFLLQSIFFLLTATRYATRLHQRTTNPARHRHPSTVATPRPTPRTFKDHLPSILRHHHFPMLHQPPTICRLHHTHQKFTAA
jgi:hypothetical protein